MYRRITTKLFNTTTPKVEVKVKMAKRGSLIKPIEKREKPKHEKCPHLSSDRTCARMINEGLDGSLSDFDIKHFCNGNPLHCYYFRLPTSKAKK